MDERAMTVARVRSAAERTTATGSARVAIAKCPGSPVPGEADELGDGVVDFANRRALVSVLLLTPRMRERFDQQETAAGKDGPGLTQMLARRREMLYDGGAHYLRHGEWWVVEGDGEPGDPRDPEDPAWALDALFGARDDVVDVGEEEVRGVRTVRYRLTVDFTVADEAVPAGVVAPTGSLREMRAWPVEVWLDAEGLVRRIGIPAMKKPRKESTWDVAEFWDLGTTVSVPAPEPEQIWVPTIEDWTRIVSEGIVSPDLT